LEALPAELGGWDLVHCHSSYPSANGFLPAHFASGREEGWLCA